MYADMLTHLHGAVTARGPHIHLSRALDPLQQGRISLGQVLTELKVLHEPAGGQLRRNLVEEGLRCQFIVGPDSTLYLHDVKFMHVTDIRHGILQQFLPVRAVDNRGLVSTNNRRVLVSVTHQHHDVLQRPLTIVVRYDSVKTRRRGGAAILVQGGQGCGALSTGRISTGLIGERHISEALAE